MRFPESTGKHQNRMYVKVVGALESGISNDQRIRILSVLGILLWKSMGPQVEVKDRALSSPNSR